MERLVARVRAILLTPQTEWLAIAREPGDAASLFTRYVAILAAIPALARFIGSSIIGGYTPFFSGLIAAMVGYLLSFVVVYAVALIIDLLAPTFETEKNFPAALKLSVYCHTPFWLAGVFLVIPGLSFLTMLGLYGVYLLLLGLPPLMRTPLDKALVYAAAAVGCAILLSIALAAIQFAMFGGAR